MSLDDSGLNSKPSLIGSCFSIAVTISLLLYAAYQISNVMFKNGWKMTTSLREDYFSEKDSFGFD